MAVERDTRNIEANDLIFTWDDSFTRDGKSYKAGEEALCFSSFSEGADVDESEDLLGLDAYGPDGENVLSTELSLEEEGALLELLQARADRRFAEDEDDICK